MRMLSACVLLVLLVVAGVSPVFAQEGRGNGKGPPSFSSAPHRLVPGEYQLGVDDKAVISGWVLNNRHAEPRKLPLGLEKKLRAHHLLRPGESGGLLPPGLAKRLGPVAEGYVRVVIESDVLLIELESGAMVDILRGVF